MSQEQARDNFDLRQTLTERKVVGLWRLAHGYRGLYAIAILAAGLTAVSRTGIYYLLRYFVDDVLLDEGQLWQIPWVASGFIVLALFQGFFTYGMGRLAAQTAEGIVRRLRDYLYDHIQRLNFSYHDRMQTGELLQRTTSDVDTLRRLFQEQLIGIGRISLLFLVNFSALLLLHVELALYSVVVIPVIIVLSHFFFKRMEKVYEAYQSQDARLSNQLQENLSGVRVVKAFARQEFEIERFEEENEKKYQRGVELANLHASFWPITDILCGGQMLVGFYLAALYTISGEITVGTYLAYAGLIINTIWPIRGLGRLVAHISTGIVSLDRVQQIIKQDREPLDDGDYEPNEGTTGAIRFESVTFAYETPADAEQRARAVALDDAGERTVVLHDVSFEARPGETVGLLGATGSGKSSLVNLLPRFYDYGQGSITLDGVELRRYSRGYLRSQIGIVQQEPFLFSTTIRNNITYGVGREVSDEEVEAAARAARIHEVILTFPRGYNTLVGEKGVTLSGGQKQRITIARTLLKNPSILILDDATSSVDTETDAAIREALRTLSRRRTTFVIAHRVQSVMDADSILVMDEGRIVQRGTHEELLAEGGIYRHVYELQAQIEADLEQEIAQTVDAADRRLASKNGRNGIKAESVG